MRKHEKFVAAHGVFGPAQGVLVAAHGGSRPAHGVSWPAHGELCPAHGVSGSAHGELVAAHGVSGSAHDGLVEVWGASVKLGAGPPMLLARLSIHLVESAYHCFMAIPWKCPFCNRNASITENRLHRQDVHFLFDGTASKEGVIVEAIKCPAKDCEKVQIVALQATFKWGLHDFVRDEFLQVWHLVPDSSAIQMPEYVPGPIAQDYYEACRIATLSPKASATLSRRCLQGMIRDFWKVNARTLAEEIRGIEDKVDPATWKAIDAIRSVGNIGAHMEKDINVIVDVDSGEAEMLLRLIEMLVKDWYVARQQRQEQLDSVLQIAATKKALQNGSNS